MDSNILHFILERSKRAFWRPILYLNVTIHDALESDKWKYVLRLNRMMLYDAVRYCRNMNEMCLLLNRATRLSGDTIDEIFRINREEVFKRLPSLHTLCTFAPAAKYGRLEFLKWLITKHNKKSLCTSYNIIEFFTGAVKNGHINVLQWLLKEFDINTKHYIFIKYGYFLHIAVENDQLAMLEWLAQTITPNNQIPVVEKDVLLKLAAKCGNLNIIKWIIEYFNIAPRNNLYIGKVVKKAAYNGHLPVVQWLIEYFKLTKYERIDGSIYTLLDLINRRNFETFMWLVEHFKIDKEILSANNNCLLICALKKNDLELARWLIRRCGLA